MQTIRQLRAAREWTQLDLANALGVQPSTVYNWESGKTQPDAVKLRSLARVLGVSMDDIALVGIDTDREGNPLASNDDGEQETAA